MKPRLMLLALFAIAALAACSSADNSASEPSDGRSQSPPSSLPARWWLWAESTGSRNPIADTTGSDCGVKQPSDVWFLAGTFGGSATRECAVPVNRPIYFPVMTSICEVVRGAAVERALEDCDLDPQKVTAELDGKKLKIETATSEGFFTFQAGSESMISNSNARFQAVAWGEWVGPLALSEGDHVLRFAATSEDFELAVTYRLAVN